MGTLLMRLAAPMQSWGVEPQFETCKTEREPSKSGVVGLLAAALGKRRDENLDSLNALRFGVRVDQEGQIICDYHTVSGKKPYVTHRYYLSDSVFLAGFEGEDEFLASLARALNTPKYPLFLGRRSCPPTLPLCLGVRPLSLEDALKNEPWQAAEWRQKKLPKRLRILIDCDGEKSTAVRRHDLAKSFSPLHREYGWRGLCELGYVEIENATVETAHDAMFELRGEG